MFRMLGAVILLASLLSGSLFGQQGPSVDVDRLTTPIAASFRDAADPEALLPFPVGYRWTYRSSDGELPRIETTAVKPEASKHDDDQVGRVRVYSEVPEFGGIFIPADRGGWIRCGHSYKYFDVTPEEWSTFLPAALSIAQSWIVRDHYESMPLTEVARGTVTKREQVSVPAGVFDTWVVEYDWSQTLGSGTNLTVWLAPGVGVVRVVERGRFEWKRPVAIDQPRTMELVSVELTETAHPVDYPTPPRALSKLPERIPVTPRRLSMHVDYEDRWRGHVVVHLINATDDDLNLAAQDGDPYLKLFTRGTEGDWLRAQKHQYSSCGNSYMSGLTIPKQSYRSFLGYVPEEGETREVRYQLMSSNRLVSNVGRLPVSDIDIEAASEDRMSQVFVECPEEPLGALLAPLAEGEDYEDRQRRLLSGIIASQRPDVRLLLRRYLTQGSPSAYEIEQMLSPWWLRQTELAWALQSEDPRLRYQALRQSLEFVPTRAQETLDLLIADPGQRLPGRLAEHLAKSEKGRATLESIRDDARRFSDQRDMARLYLEYDDTQRRDRQPVRVEASLAGELTPPGKLEINIHNRSEEPLTIRYRDLSEILTFFVHVSEAEEDCLVPRRVRTTGSTEPSLVEEVLEPGAKHRLSVDLCELYDLDRWLHGPITYGCLYTRLALPSHDPVVQWSDSFRIGKYWRERLGR